MAPPGASANNTQTGGNTGTTASGAESTVNTNPVEFQSLSRQVSQLSLQVDRIAQLMMTTVQMREEPNQANNLELAGAQQIPIQPPINNTSRVPHVSSRDPRDARIRIDKWGLQFNGDSTHMDVEDFIFRVEHLQQHYDMPWSEILRDFHLLMTGNARDWYWLFVQTKNVSGWDPLKMALKTQFQTNRSNFEK